MTPDDPRGGVIAMLFAFLIVMGVAVVFMAQEIGFRRGMAATWRELAQSCPATHGQP